MAQLGFKRLLSDSGIFVLMRNNKVVVIAVVYVDDAIFMGRDKSQVNTAKKAFMQTW